MKQASWLFLTGAAAIGLLVVVTRSEKAFAVKPAPRRTDGEIGYDTVESVGTDSDGVEYVVQVRGNQYPDGEFEVFNNPTFYRAARSDGRGGYMALGVNQLLSLDAARTRAQDAFDRASVVTPTAPPIGPPQAGLTQEDTNIEIGEAALSGYTIVDVDTASSAAGGQTIAYNDPFSGNYTI